MKRYALDTSALIAFFQDEPGAAKVQELLTEARQAEHPLLLSVVNWGELYYVAWQRMGEAAAQQRVQEIARLPIELVDVDRETALLAATLKAQHKLPYADCFAAALAQQRKATLVTDDKDFQSVQRGVNVLWVTSN